MTRHSGSGRIRATPPRLVLGTAQLGLAYGIANRSGCPSEEEALAILRAAVARGIRAVDTARAYGDAERRIGLALADVGAGEVAVVTKLSALAEVPRDAASGDAVSAARRSLEESRQALRRRRIDVLLLHRAEHRKNWDGAVWRFLAGEMVDGGIGRLGVSVQSPSELRDALEDRLVTHVQLPFNLLDHRWAEAGMDVALAARPDVEVHARSALLQGLLALDTRVEWPRIEGLVEERIRTELLEATAELGRADPVDLGLAFVRSMPWIDGVVVGAETRQQLEELAAHFDRPTLDAAALRVLRGRLSRMPEALLDPSRWPSR